MKTSRLFLISSILALQTQLAWAGNGIEATTETIFIPLGNSGTADKRSITMLYGIRGFSEINDLFRVTYGISGNILNGSIVSTPITVSYVPFGNYKFNLRPHFFIGFEPFFSNMPDFSGVRLYATTGLGLDYIFENQWVFNVSSKIYINDSFFQEDLKNNVFNSGTVALSAGFGYMF